MAWQHEQTRRMVASLRDAADAARQIGWLAQADLYEREAELAEQALAAKVRLGDWPPE
jgi:hypothetical protein